MSTTTVTYSSTAKDIEIEKLRRREAEARKAARRAAQREKERKRREEAERRRIAAANKKIEEQEAIFQQAVGRLDKAASRLPDLALTAPRLSSMASDISQNPDKLEDYAVQLQNEVGRFIVDLDTAIVQAERLFARRIEKAEAWRTSADLEMQLKLKIKASEEIANVLHENIAMSPPPKKPASDAELESVSAYVNDLKKHLQDIDKLHSGLCARAISRERSAELSGSQVKSQNATEIHDNFEAEKRKNAQTQLQSHLEETLTDYNMSKGEISEGLRMLLDDALAQAHLQDQKSRITRWIAKKKQSSDGVQRAISLMQNSPDLIHDDPSLAGRWDSLLIRLQRIAGGLEAFTDDVEKEYVQLQADANRLLKTAFTKADWLQAMSSQGFEIYEQANSQGLVVVDLDHPEVWLETTPLEAEQGGFAAVLELKTDADLSQNDNELTEAICQKLENVTKAAKQDVSANSEVVERKSHIDRERRPAKAWAQQL